MAFDRLYCAKDRLEQGCLARTRWPDDSDEVTTMDGDMGIMHSHC
jgi:hypothetical protein